MIGMSFKPPGTTQEWWDAWSPRAERATRQAIDAFESWFDKNDGTNFSFKPDDRIWKDLKLWYSQYLFISKCAYCEAEFSRYYGDAEHYRPKSSVRTWDAQGARKFANCDVPDHALGGTPRSIRHPGYFWLAYDWRNIIPACVMCNSGRGKNDRFEVAKQYVVLQKLSPVELEQLPDHTKPQESRKWPGYFYPSPPVLDVLEDPLLLNPLNPSPEKNPRKHLRFGLKGTVAGLTPYGEMSIRTLQLSATDLQIQRENAVRRFQDELFDSMRRFPDPPEFDRSLSDYLDPYERGERAFSAAKLDHWDLLNRRLVRPPTDGD
jgi:hypothetical protein